MKLRGGKNIDPIELWSNYCDIKPGPGTFLALTYCPSPDHLNSRSPAFQINQVKPLVCCFSSCGISGTYEHAICIVEGIYDKLKITDEDIALSKVKWQAGESSNTRTARSKVRRAHVLARKIIFTKTSVGYRPGASPKIADAKNTYDRIKLKASVKKEIAEEVLADSRYLPKPALEYLKERGIDEASRSRWQIGFDEESNRLVIPARDSRDRIRFLIKRAIEPGQRPPYLLPEDSHKKLLLFGTCNLDKTMLESQGIIVVEGAMDVIRLHQHGYRNTVGILGSSLSDQQRNEISKLRPKRIYLMFDKDAAGVIALETSAPKLIKQHQVKVVLYPKGKDLDPAKLTKKQLGYAINHAQSYISVRRKIAKVKRKELIA